MSKSRTARARILLVRSRRHDPVAALRTRAAILIIALTTLGGCGWPMRTAVLTDTPAELAPIPRFTDVRAIDGYPNESFQRSFDSAIAKLAERSPPAGQRRRYEMLVLSSGGVNGAFGAGILTGWTRRGDRPVFDLVTGVSVGALMTPFAFAGPQFDERLETLFRRIAPGDLHREKGILSSVLWDESLMDNSPLARAIERGVDHELLAAVAAGHAEGRRCMVGSTNLDIGAFMVWDLGAIASRGTDEALALFRKVLRASASIPVVYSPGALRARGTERTARRWRGRPPVVPAAERLRRLPLGGPCRDLLGRRRRHALRRPQRLAAAARGRGATRHAGDRDADRDHDELHHGCRGRAPPLHAFARLGAEFRFLTLADGLELSVDAFTPEDTERLFLLGQGIMGRDEPWRRTPPGYVVRTDLERIRPNHDNHEDTANPTPAARSVESRLDRIERWLRSVDARLEQLGGVTPPAERTGR